MQTNQSSAHTYITSFIGLLHSGPLLSRACPNHPRARDQMTGDSPRASESLELFKLASPKPADSALPIPSHGNYKVLSPHPPVSL